MAVVRVAGSNQDPTLLAVDSRRADSVLAWGRAAVRPDRSVRSTVHPDLADPIVLRPGSFEAEVDLQEVDSPSPLRLTARLDDAGSTVRLDLGPMRPGVRRYSATVPEACAGGCRLAALAVNHPGTDIGNATATLAVRSLSRPDDAVREIAADFARPAAWRPGTPSTGGPEVRLRPGAALVAEIEAPGGPYAEIVRGDAPEPLPALVSRGVRDPSSAAAGGVTVGTTTGISGRPTRYRAASVARYVPGVNRAAVMVDLELALRLTEQAPDGLRQVWLSRDDAVAERRLRDRLADAGVVVSARSSSAELERGYAGDGAVLALRLLLLCGAAAVVVAVGALLVAAYVGRRQRAYEVAALRAVGLRRRTLRGLLLRENLGTVLVALVCGSLAAAVATWVTLPALPEFDTPSSVLAVRHTPHAVSAWAAVGGLAAVLVTVGLVVAVLQMRSGRYDRLREGVR
jgi:hypothetical protein